jgi:glycosyltransferase involved in cell wall biosynthesis
MRIPCMAEFPRPTTARESGWPWTGEAIQLPATAPDGSPWPRLSIITPSYNQGPFIEQTIRSVLLQGYPNLEYIVIDGGSTDNSLAIIKKYEAWLTYWVSEPDQGQTQAINKGLARCSGKIRAYLNSDDIYYPYALEHVARVYNETKFDVFIGQGGTIGLNLPPFQPWRRSHWKQYWHYTYQPFVYPYIPNSQRYELPQHSMFWSAEKSRGLLLNEDFDFTMDLEWFLRLFSGARVVHSTRKIAAVRIHANSKSSTMTLVHKREYELLRNGLIATAAAVPKQCYSYIVHKYRRESLRAVLAKCFSRNDKIFEYRYPDYG